jgi:hypothetical protein
MKPFANYHKWFDQMYSKALSHDAKPLYLQMWCIDAIGYKNVIFPSNIIVQYTK